jgi:hypothetical protein
MRICTLHASQMYFLSESKGNGPNNWDPTHGPNQFLINNNSVPLNVFLKLQFQPVIYLG